MSQSKNKQLVCVVVILFVIIFIAINPAIYTKSAYNGLVLWATIVLPSLLPFFFFTKILSYMPQVYTLTKPLKKPIGKLYNCPPPASYICLMSIISGYPVGAKLTSEFYKNNLISSAQAHRIISFCSTSGPLFIIGSVGVSLFCSKTCGFVIFASHIIASLLNGLIYRKYKLTDNNDLLPTITTSNNILNDSMYNTIVSTMLVGGFISISFVMIDMLNNIGLLTPINYVLSPITSTFGITSSAVTNGLLEVTRGCVDLSTQNINPYLLSIVSCGLISFGGISVHLQSLVFLQECKIKYRYFLLTKSTHAILSIAVCALLGIIFI